MPSTFQLEICRRPSEEIVNDEGGDSNYFDDTEDRIVFDEHERHHTGNDHNEHIPVVDTARPHPFIVSVYQIVDFLLDHNGKQLNGLSGCKYTKFLWNIGYGMEKSLFVNRD